jgi:hypothetical protein
MYRPIIDIKSKVVWELLLLQEVRCRWHDSVQWQQRRRGAGPCVGLCMVASERRRGGGGLCVSLTGRPVLDGGVSPEP